jgi:hypothetical protein
MMTEHTQVGNVIKFEFPSLVITDANITIVENGIWSEDS